MSGLHVHLPVLPVVLPLLTAAALLLLLRAPLEWKRVLSLVSTVLLGVVVLGLGIGVEHAGLLVYQVGNWPSFAGIVLLADRLAVLMLVLLVLLALASQLYAAGSDDDRRGPHFHALFQFQLMGLCGAFLTHDLFNLFVFFEVLLAASYGLLLHGQGGERLRQGLHYVVLNLVASALFLFAVGVLYAALGSLNLADLSARVAAMPAESQPLVMAGAVLLVLVFALKAALLPLYFWLPRTYASASAPAAILFAIMTKLGVYAVVRVYVLVFGAAAFTGALQAGLFWAGAGTTLLAALGALAATQLRGLLGYLVVGSAGVLFMALGLGSLPALAAALYYLAHSTLAMAAFFLLADWVRRHRDGGDGLSRVGVTLRAGLLGGLFAVLAIAAAGLPPLGGFLGKSLLLANTAPAGPGVVLWTLVLVASLLNLVALVRAGSRLFWQQPAIAPSRTPAAVAAPALGERLGLLVLLAALLGTAVLAGRVVDYVGGSAAQLADTAAYRDAVLGKTPLPTTVPQ
ncbi:MAG: monovalent cation/H+ antiporter subunit D [Xanthomonadaceae bacterium]|jgi:multicomponent K+:H+ antiporter subunit D|nr:monovalent cation/H+ antiporter subunit D [Xanthomonadaceae bacterium]MCZ8317740.1 monovalent cation/H+ antiporter subunit D [Silanimonas sp.]